MDQLHQLPGFFRHKALDKIHIIPVLSGGNPEGRIIVPIVHNVLRSEGVAVFGLEFLQRLHTDGCSVSEPVHEFFLCVASEHQREMVKKCGEAHNIRIRVIL